MPRYKMVNGERIQLTAEEEAAWEAGAVGRAQANLRAKRNQLLAETDYYALSDVTMSADMETYRQELRDLPDGKDTVAKCTDATFPTKPQLNG